MDSISEALMNMHSITSILLDYLQNGTLETTEFQQNLLIFSATINNLPNLVDESILEDYVEEFNTFVSFCEQCRDEDFIVNNVDRLMGLLSLILECIGAIYNSYVSSVAVCPCCGQSVIFVKSAGGEKELSCPVCGSNNDDRCLIAFMKENHFEKAKEGLKLLLVSPTKCLERWLEIHCPQIECWKKNWSELCDEIVCDVESTKEYSRIEYDVVMCSHKIGDLNDNSYIFNNIVKIINEKGYFACLSEKNFCKEMTYRKKLIYTDNMVLIKKSENTSVDVEYKYSVDEEFCKNGPLVSVYMSAYNHEEFVEQAILSVINQSYKNIEFLVADDASTDSTAEVMKKYEKYYSRAIYFDKNSGGRGAELRRIATGKYIALMNSDDVWDPDKIYLQVKYMEEHPEIGVCFTWCKYTDRYLKEISNDIFVRGNKSQKEWLRYFWDNGNCLCNPSSLARREYRIRTQNIGRECRQLPDFFNWVELIQITGFHIIPRTLIWMRRHSKSGDVGGNTSEVNSNNAIRERMENGIHWMWNIRNMDNQLFYDTFNDLFVDKNASSQEELGCEKLFLMLNSNDVVIQFAALTYLAEILPQIEECLLNHYGYSLRNIGDDYLTKGFAQFFIKNMGTHKENDI